MNKEQLLQEISKTLKKSKVIALAKIVANADFPINDLLISCYHQEKSIAFRAAWILESVAYKYPARFVPILEDFINELNKQRHDSCQRHFSKILIHFTDPKAKAIRKEAFSKLSETAGENVVDIMFEWLINPGTPVAVRVNCMEVLYYMTPKFPWIKEELLAQIIFYMKDGSAAMQSRGRVLIEQINYL